MVFSVSGGCGRRVLFRGAKLAEESIGDIYKAQNC